MGIVERARHLAGELDGLCDRQSAHAGQPPSQRLAFDEWHDVVEQAVGAARVDEGEDVWVVEAGGDLYLAEKPVRADVRGQMRMQHLHCHGPAMLEVLGQIDRGHATPPDFPLEVVAAGERTLQAVQDVWHRNSIDVDGNNIRACQDVGQRGWPTARCSFRRHPETRPWP